MAELPGDWRAVFGLLDEDQCGAIYASDALAVIERVGSSLSAVEISERLAGMVDSDGDGLIDEDEFHEWWLANPTAAAAVFAPFPRFIAEQDKIARATSLEQYLDDLRAKFMSAGDRFNTDYLRNTFAEFDHDGGGTIDAVEFRAVCRRELQPLQQSPNRTAAVLWSEKTLHTAKCRPRPGDE